MNALDGAADTVVVAVFTPHPQAVAVATQPPPVAVVATRRRRAAADAGTPHPQAEATAEAVVAVAADPPVGLTAAGSRAGCVADTWNHWIGALCLGVTGSFND